VKGIQLTGGGTDAGAVGGTGRSDLPKGSTGIMRSYKTSLGRAFKTWGVGADRGKKVKESDGKSRTVALKGLEKASTNVNRRQAFMERLSLTAKRRVRTRTNGVAPPSISDLGSAVLCGKEKQSSPPVVNKWVSGDRWSEIREHQKSERKLKKCSQKATVWKKVPRRRSLNSFYRKQ